MDAASSSARRGERAGKASARQECGERKGRGMLASGSRGGGGSFRWAGRRRDWGEGEGVYRSLAKRCPQWGQARERKKVPGPTSITILLLQQACGCRWYIHKGCDKPGGLGRGSHFSIGVSHSQLTCTV